MATSIICCCAPVFPSVFAGFKWPKALSSILSSLRSSKGRSGSNTDPSDGGPWEPKIASHPSLTNTPGPKSAGNQMSGRINDGYEVTNTGQSSGAAWVPGSITQPSFAWAQVPVVYQADGQPSYGYGFVNAADSRNGVFWVPMNFSQPNLVWTQPPAANHSYGPPSDGYGSDNGSQHMASNYGVPDHVNNLSYPMQGVRVPQDPQFR